MYGSIKQHLRDELSQIEAAGLFKKERVIAGAQDVEITLDDELELDDYRHNLGRMYGEETLATVIGAVEGSVRFPGLTPTNMQLDGLEKHQRLIDSYKKLHAARAAKA